MASRSTSADRISRRNRQNDSPPASPSPEKDRERRRHRRRHYSSDEESGNSIHDRGHRSKSHRHRSRSDSREASDKRRRRHGDREYRDRSRSGDRSHHRRRTDSPPPKKRRRSHDEKLKRSKSPASKPRSRAPLPSQNESFTGTKAITDGEPPTPDKQKPNFKPTGLLAKEANTVAGTTTVLKYHEPPEARKPPPKQAWRMYVFKAKDLVDTIYLHQRSAWLFGRDQKVTDYLLEHPSISKQHAVIQFRHITSTNEYGDKGSKVKPYLIDLDSANGTKMNGQAVEASRFVELVDGDVVAFGDSEREYVLMLPPP